MQLAARLRRIAVAAAAAAVLTLSACAPEVGSERWCEAMSDKPRGDWSTNEALDYARHCIIE